MLEERGFPAMTGKNDELRYEYTPVSLSPGDLVVIENLMCVKFVLDKDYQDDSVHKVLDPIPSGGTARLLPLKNFTDMQGFHHIPDDESLWEQAYIAHDKESALWKEAKDAFSAVYPSYKIGSEEEDSYTIHREDDKKLDI